MASHDLGIGIVRGSPCIRGQRARPGPSVPAVPGVSIAASVVGVGVLGRVTIIVLVAAPRFMTADPHRLSSMTGSGTPLVSLRVLVFNFASVAAVAPKREGSNFQDPCPAALPR
jgi:hypothetical protein